MKDILYDATEWSYVIRNSYVIQLRDRKRLDVDDFIVYWGNAWLKVILVEKMSETDHGEALYLNLLHAVAG
jgi:hypothetical protein